MRSNGPEGGGQDARHKLPGIKLSRRLSRKTGPFCVSTNSSCHHIYKPSPRRYGKLASFLHQESSYEPLLKTLEHIWH
ncbi:hypothetical protein DWS20_24985 [Escherichia coli]|nr:hypothetical protein [Escherichia coli]EFO2072555.1 hypothetical protein [Escherichia coli O8]EEY6090504.1 hypothetical protein [Escherichia coli]EFO1482083.1 hypothetical protein [Escherichia coli]EFO1491453.1 hypothetical protein [Escherichia coli]